MKFFDLFKRHPARPEPVKPEPIRPEPIRPEPVRPKPVRPEPARPEPIFVQTPENDGQKELYCRNCYKSFEGDEPYCRHCGTRRGQGAFAPRDNRFQCIYGPAPRKRTYTCSNCGYHWESEGMVADEYCPQCGERVFEEEDFSSW